MFHVKTSHTEDRPADTLRAVARARRPGGGYKLLVERQLGESVTTWVMSRRRAGATVKAIAEEMTRALDYPDDVDISRRLIESWVPEVKTRPTKESQ